MPTHHRFYLPSARPLFTLLVLALGGCNIIGGAAGVMLANQPLPARYNGLKGQNIAIMVWADQATQMDYPTIRLDVATALQSTLNATKEDDLKGVRFIDPRSVIRWQESHPDLDGMALQDIAPKMGVSRVIFVEVQSVQTKAPLSPDLFKGTILGTVKIAEVSNPGSTSATQPTVAKIAYEEQNIRTIFPQKAPEGVLDANPDDFYHRTVKQFAEQVSLRFYSHPKDAEQEDQFHVAE